jgi:hypothetical protein
MKPEKDTKQSSDTKQRVMPRVSTATGGLMPGIDPKNVARSVQEMEDLEYIERLKNGFRD